jgi:triacylglycerol lipase
MPASTHPIVLAHGIARFDILAKEIFDRIQRLGEDTGLEDRLHYFRCIRSTLEADGFVVEYSDVPWAESVESRSRALKANIERVLSEQGAEQVHIIAHSMGGLDARHMLFDNRGENFHRKVASLTTIGTPHHGTSFADWGMANTVQLRGLLALAQNDSLDGFEDLTTDACAAFNHRAEAFEDHCGVSFQTYTGTQPLAYVFAPLQLSWLLIWRAEGDNDGLVSLRSAMWKNRYFKGRIDADHLNEVGWWDESELGPRLFPPTFLERRADRKEMEARIRELYLEIARDLRDRFPTS